LLEQPRDRLQDHPGQKPDYAPDQKSSSAQKTAASDGTEGTGETPRTARIPTLPSPIPETELEENPGDATRTSPRPLLSPPAPSAGSRGEIPGLRALD
jgi:hypothetical protein